MKKMIFLLLLSHWCFGQWAVPVNNGKLQFSQYDSKYQAVLATAQAKGIKLPSKACMDAQNTLIVALDVAVGGIATTFDQFIVMVTDGPANFTNINWANPGYRDMVQVYNPKFIPLVGFDNGILNNTTYTPGNEYLNVGKLGGLYTLNSCEQIYYYRDIQVGTYNDGGFMNSAPQYATSLNATRTATTTGFNVNELTTGTQSVSGTDINDGLYFMGRTSGSSAFVKKGSGSRITKSTSSAAIWPYDFFLLGRCGDTQTQTPASGGGYKKISLFTSGRLLTTTEETDIKTAWDNYLTAIAAITPLSTIGTVYNVSSWSNLNDFTNNGATVTATSNQLQFTGGTNTFTQTLDLSSISGTAIGATKLSKWTQTIQFIVPTLTGTNWIGVGIRSSNANGNYYDLVCRIDFTSGSTGKMKLYTGPTHTLSRTTTSALSMTAGDIVSLSFTLDGGFCYYSCQNITTSSAVIYDNLTLYTGTGGFIDNTGHFAVFDGGGGVSTNKITSWTVSSNEYKGGIVFLGDSKTQCYEAASTSNSGVRNNENSYTYLLQRKIGPIVNLGGSSDRTADYLTRTYEIINWVQPSTVVIVGVCNDIRAGVSSAIWQANILSLISTFQAAGIKVIFWTGFKENFSPGTGIDQSAVSTWAAANLIGVCDVWDSVVNNYDLSDYVHPTTNGHLQIANDALSYGKLNYK
jgi:lysophospholipase L1-like esterase